MEAFLKDKFLGKVSLCMEWCQSSSWTKSIMLNKQRLSLAADFPWLINISPLISWATIPPQNSAGWKARPCSWSGRFDPTQGRFCCRSWVECWSLVPSHPSGSFAAVPAGAQLTLVMLLPPLRIYKTHLPSISSCFTGLQQFQVCPKLCTAGFVSPLRAIFHQE